VPAGCRFHPRCPLVMDRCRTDEPPEFARPDGGYAACWLSEHSDEPIRLPSRPDRPMAIESAVP
jgi:hypothetical protein